MACGQDIYGIATPPSMRFGSLSSGVVDFLHAFCGNWAVVIPVAAVIALSLLFLVVTTLLPTLHSLALYQLHRLYEEHCPLQMASSASSMPIQIASIPCRAQALCASIDHALYSNMAIAIKSPSSTNLASRNPPVLDSIAVPFGSIPLVLLLHIYIFMESKLGRIRQVMAGHS